MKTLTSFQELIQDRPLDAPPLSLAGIRDTGLTEKEAKAHLARAVQFEIRESESLKDYFDNPQVEHVLEYVLLAGFSADEASLILKKLGKKYKIEGTYRLFKYTDAVRNEENLLALRYLGAAWLKYLVVEEGEV